jgi:uncharacterized protein (DUF1499 family)
MNIAFDTLPILKKAIRDLGGTIHAENDNYIASTFSSTIFGFVDDFEIRIDSIQKVIHIRSAARVGYSDTGVNKKRTELLKKQYNKKVSDNMQSFDATSNNGAQ